MNERLQGPAQALSATTAVAWPRRVMRRHGLAYIFVAPATVFLIALFFWPLAQVLIESLQQQNLLQIDVSSFIGLANYATELGGDQYFWPAFQHTLAWTFASVAGEYALGLLTAILLVQPIRFRGLLRGIFIIPWVVPFVVAASTWKWIMDPYYGILNLTLMKWGWIAPGTDWLGQLQTALPAVIVVNIWRSFPFYALALLAALQTVPAEELEAASLDGAGLFARFRYVTFPYLKGTSLIIVILHVIWTFQNFDFIWLLTQGGPLHVTETLPILVYLQAFRYYNLGTSAAIAVLILLALSIFVAIYIRLLGRESLSLSR
jgi:multiple sugar transport system permease protein